MPHFVKSATLKNVPVASELFLKMESKIYKLQKTIRKAVEEIELTEKKKNETVKKFEPIRWNHKDHGGGKSLILSNGGVFEKAGLNVSSLQSRLSEEVARVLKTNPEDFRVCGLSLVFHPRSPLIPTVHMNIRYFEMKHDSWFGGGIDLTPYYPFEEDFVYFHRKVREAVEEVYPLRYHEFKKKCDDYFYLPHRKEMRGVGGVFFDFMKDLGEKNENHEANFRLVSRLGDFFLPAYLPLVNKHKNRKYGKEEVAFQQFRRGRYVEFNLLYDRGTLFGLKSGGNVDAILMSLPPVVHFPSRKEISFKTGVRAQMNRYYQPKEWA